MASLNVKTEYSEYKDCKLRVGKYVEDNSVAVEIYNRWDGPIARVTTCLCDLRWRKMRRMLTPIIALGR